MIQAMIAVVMRWLHVASAGTLTGLLVFMVLCAGPAAAWLEKEQDLARMRRIERRVRWLMAGAIGGIVTGGIYNWAASAAMYRAAGPGANVVLGVKVVVACVAMSLLWAQDVGLMAARRARVWRVVCLVLALGVMLLGAVVRYLRLQAVGS